MDLYNYMVEWAISYEKHRDIIKKDIASIEKRAEGYDLLVRYKDTIKYLLIIPTLGDVENLSIKLKEGKNTTIITINSAGNLQFLIDNWKRFIDFSEFTIIFINPFSMTDKRWMIRPHVHNKIAENCALEKGMKSMFSAVEPITEEEFIKEIKEQ